MHRRTVMKTTLWAALAVLLSQTAKAQGMDSQSQASIDTFMAAMSSGGIEKLCALMVDDMDWHNEGDTSLPWIGKIKGKENTDAFASGNTVAVFERMSRIVSHSGQETGVFSFALRAKFRDGQLVLWHWHEHSFVRSQPSATSTDLQG